MSEHHPVYLLELDGDNTPEELLSVRLYRACYIVASACCQVFTVSERHHCL